MNEYLETSANILLQVQPTLLMTVTCIMNKANVFKFMVKLVPSWKTRVSCCFCQVNMKSALDPGFPDLPLEESSFQNGLLNKYSVECYKIFLLFSCFYRNFTLKFLSGYYIEQLTPLGSFLLHPTPGQKFFIFFFFRFRHNDNLTCFRKSEEESSQSNATCSPSGTLSLQFYL